LIYGGGNVGLTGELADAVLRMGGEVQGIIPEDLMALEVGHKGLTNSMSSAPCTGARL
jgi:predicted Rossmann-fold nucleotide-binding protein